MRHPLVLLLILLLAAPLVAGPTLAAHTGAPSARTYTAETLLDARWSTGAVKADYTARPLWQDPLTGRGVRVGIIDTGIDADHPDLSGSTVAWRDFIERRARPYDDDTHGTHVAGIIAARGHLQPDPLGHYFPFGAQGVAPGVALIVAKAMDRQGDGDAQHVADAIYWMLDPDGDGDYDDGAEIINLSIGVELPPEQDDDITGPVTVPALPTQDPEDLRTIRAAIRHAVSAGAIVVVAAGNHEPGAASDTVTFPGTMDEVITVGATDRDGDVAAFSNAGTPGSAKPDLVAPGILLSTFPTARDTQDGKRDGYLALGGTSMAAPLVTGTVALMLEADPSLRGLDAAGGLEDKSRRIKTALIASAEPAAGAQGHHLQYGHGHLRVDAALAALAPVDGGLDGSRILTALFLVGLVALFVVARRRDRRRRAALRRLRAELAARAAAGRDTPADAREPLDPRSTVRDDPARVTWVDAALDDSGRPAEGRQDPDQGMLFLDVSETGEAPDGDAAPVARATDPPEPRKSRNPTEPTESREPTKPTKPTKPTEPAEPPASRRRRVARRKRSSET